MYLLREILSVCMFVRSEKINQISTIRHYSLKNKAFQSYYSHSCFRSIAHLSRCSCQNGDAVEERLVNKLSDEAEIETFFCKLTGFTTSKRVIRNKYLEISEFRISANKKSLKMNFYFFSSFSKTRVGGFVKQGNKNKWPNVGGTTI